MGVSVNIAGQVFGRLIAIEPTEERDSSGRIIWRCICSCADKTEYFVGASNLRNGHTQSCGCLQKERAAEACSLDLTGQVFGRLTALEPTKERCNHSVVWQCICNCIDRTLCFISAKNLISSDTQSCGCLQKERVAEARSIDLTGQTFGRLTAIESTKERDSSGSVVWRCICNCAEKTICLIPAKSLTSGNTQSCGCLHKEKASEECAGRYGPKNPLWKGGISFEPYPFEFNTAFKEKIRDRDNRICRNCSKTERENGQRLSVHHIDYIKENINPANLLSLCAQCHSTVNQNRDYWQAFFTNLILPPLAADKVL